MSESDAPSLPPVEAKLTNVWIVTEYDGGGIRGLYASQSDAELAIEGIRWAHPDLTRSDFVIQVHRLPEAILSPQTWQVIETAPKDGTPLMFAADGSHIVHLRWRHDRWEWLGGGEFPKGQYVLSGWLQLPELPAVASLRGWE